MTATPTRPRASLSGISSRAWEHPADRGALVALRRLKGFDTALKAVSGLVSERKVRLDFLGSAVRADERQLASVHRLLTEVGRALDATELPELFVVNDPTSGAMTIGMDRPVIVLNSSMLDLLDEEELRFVLGHELGHALSGHALYRTLLLRLVGLGGLWNAVPGGALGLRVIVAALYEWSRKAELSADRAGLLATQNPAVALRVHMKLASGSGDIRELDQASFLDQGREYLEAGDLRDSVLKLALVERTTHPYAVVRATELRRWVDSGEYQRILAGDYPLRADDDAAGVTDAAREAAAGYAQSFADTQDALGRLVHDLAGYVGSAKTWLDDQLRRR